MFLPIAHVFKEKSDNIFMRRVFLVITALLIFLVATIATYSAKKEPAAELKAPVMPRLKIKTVEYASKKLKVGEVTISYKYLHEKKRKNHVDASFSFFTNKPSVVSVEYGEGLNFENPKSLKNPGKSYKTNHKITIHEIPPATNFLYQITALTKTGEKAQSEKKGFLTPQLQKESPEASSFFMRPVIAVKNLVSDFLGATE